MKVLVGFFNSESNEHTNETMKKENFLFYKGAEALERIGVTPIFDRHNINLIPTLYANGHPGGLIEKATFDEILATFLADIRAHLSELDGIFLYLHGASKVRELPEFSGEHVILREIRQLVGERMPIAVVMDPHGNVTSEFTNSLQYVCCYRHSPHIDIQETFEKAAENFCQMLEANERHPHPVCIKLPLMVGGERSVSFDEPVATINQKLDALEQDMRIRCASFHVGYVRHDSDKLGCAVSVVPLTVADLSFAERKAHELADYILRARYQFHYHGQYGDVATALKLARDTQKLPLFLTDSGDNCGAGSDGSSTLLLQAFLQDPILANRQTLFAGIIAPEVVTQLEDCSVGETATLLVGTGATRSPLLTLTGKKVSEGLVSGDFVDNPHQGKVIGFQPLNTAVTILFEREAVSFTELEQFDYANCPIANIDIFVVKQGYFSPEFAAYGDAMMVLTDGPTQQAIEKLVFHEIKRPMFPYDPLDLPWEGYEKGSFPMICEVGVS